MKQTALKTRYDSNAVRGSSTGLCLFESIRRVFQQKDIPCQTVMCAFFLVNPSEPFENFRGGRA